MLTRNQIKQLLNDFATNHKQIKTFGYGEEFEQQGLKDCEYPLMWVVPISSNIASLEYSRNYRIGVFDRVRKNEENETEVESDTELVCLDILAFFNYASNKNTYSFRFNRDSISITPVYAKWSDEVTGNEVDISLVDKFTYDKCAIPMIDVAPVPPIGCADATITINEFSFGSAPSGSTFNIVVENEDGLEVGSKIGDKWIVPSGGTCADATYTIEDSLGNILYSGTIPSGGSTTEVIGNSTLNVNNSVGTLISSESILAEGTDSYNVADSVAVIKNSAGTTLKSENILATASENITINDSVAVIKDSANNTLKSENILAEATENISISDSVAVIKDSANLTLKSENILAEATENITINDSSVENSDATYSVGVLAEGSLILPDSQINVNGVDSGDVVSVKNIDVNVENSVGDPVTPTSVGLVGNTLTIEVPSGGGSYDLDLVDRFGNAFPTKQVTANATWDLRTLTPYDWADLYINSLDFTPSSTESDGIIDFYVDMQSAGILQKRYAIYIYFGSSAVNCKWNLKYPFNNDSSQVLTFVSGSVYDTDGFKGTALNKANPYNFNMIQGGNMAFFSKNNVATNNSFQLQATGDSRLFSLQIDSPNNTLFIRGAHATAAQTSASVPANRSGLWHVNHDTSNIKIRHQGTNYINNVVSMIDFPGGITYKDFFIREFSTARCQYTAFGGSLTESEMDTETTLVTALNTALGR